MGFSELMKQQKESAEEALTTSLLLMMVLFEVCGQGESCKIRITGYLRREETDLSSQLFHKVIPPSWEEHQEKSNGS